MIYSQFNNWWCRVESRYSDYRSTLNDIERKVSEFYKSKYKKDNYPVLIPQVYMHYDPKDQKFREKMESGKILTFQRMDFLIIYKGKRVIIEIDGKTHTQEEYLEKYSEQCKYDRQMKFLGYDVFRLGGYELTHKFDETIDLFFKNLYDYLDINIAD